jgi:hypothetical protein
LVATNRGEQSTRADRESAFQKGPAIRASHSLIEDLINACRRAAAVHGMTSAYSRARSLAGRLSSGEAVASGPDLSGSHFIHSNAVLQRRHQ